MVDILPRFAKWVGASILLYPWVYSVLNTIYCAPNGILDETTMTCICPVHKSGLHCNDCLVPETHGSCEGSRSVCTGLRKGTLCQLCMGIEAGDTCSDECDNNRGFYSYRDTCRYCDRQETCAGNGRCSDDGLCQCDVGWAAQTDGSEPCSLPCPTDSDAVPCSGHGVCVAGGQCQCTAPYCGELCDVPLVHPDDLQVPNISWCYGNGLPDVELGNTCSCNCKRDQYGQPMTVQDPTRLDANNYCKHLCPVGSGGHVCGNSPISFPVFDNGRCACHCSQTGPPRLTACDTDCAFGGTQKVDGDCDCPFPNQVGTYPSFCRTCKPGYFMPEFGCQAHCDDSTCITGYCDVDTQNPLRMTCRGCGNQRSGEIIEVTMNSNVIVGTSDAYGAFPNVTYDHFLSGSETRQATMEPLSATLLFARYFAFSELEVVVYVNSSENATVLIEETDSSLGDAPYRLAQPQAYQERGTYYGKPMQLSVADDTDVASLCVSRAPLCQGYTLAPPQLFRQVTTDDVSGDIIESDEVFIVATAATFIPQQPYRITIVDVVARGCATCIENYYPEPTGTALGEESCRTYCTNGTCHYNGHCSSEGTCVCDHANMDATCAKCQLNFYPEPGFDVTNPCSQSCFSDKVPDDRGTDGILLNASTCSNHGVCNATGQCRCSDTLKGPLNGFLGESCEHACNPQHNSTVVCSGHGVCIDGRCAQCEDGYFGAQCEVTCSRADQYFWKEYMAGEMVTPGTDTNVPCSREGNSMLCIKVPCNGGTCAATHQYAHLGSVISYNLCDNAVGDDNPYPLIECTGYDPGTYPYNASTGKDRVAQDLGIYCSVDNSNSASELTSRMGLCTRAECQCTRTATRISRNGIVSDNALSTRLSGPACQNAGCQISGFGNIARWASACGEYPPPAVANPLAVLYQNPDDMAQGWNNLQNLIQVAPPMCSHGTCRTITSTANGTEFSAAPATAEGVAGYCECKQTPDVSSVRGVQHRTLQGELKTQAVKCSAQGEPFWVQACCNAHVENGKSPYFGQGCSDRCLCNDAQYWKGTCAIGSTGDVVGVGCNCRAGFHADLSAGPRTRLFCGPTCDFTCKGIINRLTKTPVTDVRSACSSTFLNPTSPARQEGCYNNLVPCNGHGTCAGRNGMCMHSTSVYMGKESKCMCWGSSIQLSDVPDNYALPASVALYGGDDCSTACPGAERLDQFMEDNYETLYSENTASADDILQTKRQFVSLYAQHVCSGHGYCSTRAAVKNGILQCECPGDWGGDRCDKQCKLDSTYWGTRRPFQEQYENQEVDDRLATDFGLNVCGPRGRCQGQNSNECTLSPMYAGGRFVGQTYDEAFQYAKSLVTTDDNTFANFFQQWSMAFVGAFSVCNSAYYSARPLSRSTQDSSYIHQVPDVVGWQLTRSCDAQYRQQMSHPNEFSAPWCCQEPLSTGAWKDERFIAFGTHGGCPVEKCPNFATGRQCTECRSSAFAHLLQDAAAPCDVDKGKNQPHGYCSVCAQKPFQNMVHPYDTYTEQQRYGESELECEQCLSNKYRLSGEQQYQITQLSTQICNGHGRCMGRTKTFGGKLYGQIASDFVVDKDADELVCGEDPKLGLCECDPGFEGPTCAMPATNDACGAHGTLKNFASSYSYCECDPGHIGMYCDSHGNTGVSSQTKFISMCQVVQWVSNDAPQVIDCNDPTGNTPCRNGKCDTCAHPLLDPDAMCREYKADIVEAHQEMVKKKRVGITCST